MRLPIGVLAIATALLSAQSPSPAPDSLAPLADRLDAASTQQAKAALLDAAPAAQLAAFCYQRGESAVRQVQYERAVRSFASAAAAARKAGDFRLEARSWRAAGVAHLRMDEAPRSLEAFGQGLDAARRSGDDKLIAELLRSSAIAQRTLANYAEAIDLDQQAQAIFRRLHDSMGIVTTNTGLATSWARLGALRTAAELLEQTVQLAESINSPVGVHKALENLGSIYEIQGDSALAARFIEKSLDVKLRSGAPKSELTSVYINLTLVYHHIGRDADALEAASRAIALSRELNNQADLAYALLNRAELLRDLRRRDEALADLAPSLAISEKANTPLEISSTLNIMATVLLDLGRNQEALQIALRAAEIARRIGSPDALWRALESAGVAHQRLNRPRLARAAYAEGIRVVDDMRKQLAGGEQQGLAFLRDKINLFHGLMSLDVQFGDLTDALRVAERAKAGLILDVLRAGHVAITKTMTPVEKREEQELVRRISVLQARSRRDPEALDTAVRDLERFRSALYNRRPELKQRRGESEPLELADAARLLPDSNAVLLEFAVAPDAVYLFAVKQGRAGQPEASAYTLPWKQESLADEVEAFRSSLARRDLSYRDAAQSLYRRLLGPAEGALRGKTLVAIVPDGPLWSLPFQALIDSSGRHLIESRALFYAPSLTVLFESARSRRPIAGGSSTLLAMGDPETAPAAGAARLPSAAREVESIRRLYGEGAESFTGPRASEAEWKLAAPRHRILHLAAHAAVNAANPLYSYVLLAPGQGEDGYLETREILDLDLNAGMVVLSACDSGRGGFRQGEGVVGLSWALMVAGSPAAVVSQWPVDSDSTTRLMLEFHRRLRPVDGQPLGARAAALRQASLRLLADPAYRHPYYWAAFSLIGDGY